MLARLLIIATFCGLCAAFMAYWLGLSLWMLPLIYAFAGAVALLAGGSFSAAATVAPRPDNALPEPVPVRVRH